MNFPTSGEYRECEFECTLLCTNTAGMQGISQSINEHAKLNQTESFYYVQMKNSCALFFFSFIDRTSFWFHHC